MTKPHRQKYGLGSIIKKAVKGVKKIAKSPIGKAALIGGGLWGLNRFGIPGTGGMGQNWWSKALGRGGKFLPSGAAGGASLANKSALSKAWGGLKNFGLGKAGLLSLGAAGTILPFMGVGDEDDEEVIDDWSVTPDSIANIRQMTKDRHPSLAILPPAESVMS